jgi:hypothetical protein
MVATVRVAEKRNVDGGSFAHSPFSTGRGRRRQLRPFTVQHRSGTPAAAQVDLLEAVEGGGAQPGIHGCSAVEEMLREDAEAAARAGVGGEDAGDDGGKDLVVVVGEISPQSRLSGAEHQRCARRPWLGGGR